MAWLVTNGKPHCRFASSRLPLLVIQTRFRQRWCKRLGKRDAVDSQTQQLQGRQQVCSWLYGFTNRAYGSKTPLIPNRMVGSRTSRCAKLACTNAANFTKSSGRPTAGPGWTIYSDGQGAVYDVMLSLLDLSKNMDKYYSLQVVHNSVSNDYVCCFRWGRTGTKGRQQCWSTAMLEDAIKLFAAKFKQKTGCSWDDRSSYVPRPGKYKWLMTNPALSANKSAAVWQYFVDDFVDGKATGWYDYDPGNSVVVEALHDAYLSNPEMAVRLVSSARYMYLVDLEHMKQTNRSTGKVRPIRRHVIGGPPALALDSTNTVTTPSAPAAALNAPAAKRTAKRMPAPTAKRSTRKATTAQTVKPSATISVASVGATPSQAATPTASAINVTGSAADTTGMAAVAAVDDPPAAPAAAAAADGAAPASATVSDHCPAAAAAADGVVLASATVSSDDSIASGPVAPDVNLPNVNDANVSFPNINVTAGTGTLPAVDTTGPAVAQSSAVTAASIPTTPPLASPAPTAPPRLTAASTPVIPSPTSPAPVAAPLVTAASTPTISSPASPAPTAPPPPAAPAAVAGSADTALAPPAMSAPATTAAVAVSADTAFARPATSAPALTAAVAVSADTALATPATSATATTAGLAVNKTSAAAPKATGIGAVDPACPLPGSAKLAPGFDCMLNQTDIKGNKNKFYLLQLVESSGRYYVWSRWGRVGESGATQLQGPSTLAVAEDMFAKKFREKTGNKYADRAAFVAKPGKYEIVELDAQADGGTAGAAPKGSAKRSSFPPSQLDPPTLDFVNFIFDEDMFKQSLDVMKLDVKKMPLGRLGMGQLARGTAVLEQLEEAVEQGAARSVLEDLSSKFYQIIPHALGRQKPPVLDSVTAVQEKYDLLNVLGDIETAKSMAEEGAGATKHPSDEKYDKLKATLTLLDKTCEEYKVLEKYAQNTTHRYSGRGVTLFNVWRVDRHNEDARFKVHDHLANRKLLWHGTSVAVVAAILKSGLRIMPHSGGRVGKGIYLASEHAKSAGYTSGAKHNGKYVKVMFLVEAALGKEHHIKRDDSSLKRPPPGFDSVVARGSQEPDPSQDVMLELDGRPVVVPQGKPLPVPQYAGSSFNQSEYLLYDESQHRIRYVITGDF